MGESSFDYRVAGLRDARSQHTTAAAGATAVVEALERPGLEAGIFGAVPAAARFHANTTAFVRRKQAEAEAESARRTELADRAGRALASGVQLIVHTGIIARSVTRLDADLAAR